MLKVLNSKTKIYKNIVHFGDVHIRLLKRQQEYYEAFDKFFNSINKLSIDDTLIYIAGDIFHSKQDLTAEAVEMCRYLLSGCTSKFDTILIAGNHDANIANKTRLDSLSPIVDALNLPNLFYLKDSGLYSLGDILFSVCGVFDLEKFIHYKDIPKVYKNEYRHHIALYHGVVDGVAIGNGLILSNPIIKKETFNGYHMALIGDIHLDLEFQKYDSDNEKPVIKYCGSFLQQSHGEDINGHGYCLWDLINKSYKHIEIPNDYGFLTVEVDKGKLITDISNIPKKPRIRISSIDSTDFDIKAALEAIKAVSSNIDEVSYKKVESTVKVSSNINLANIFDVNYQNTLFTNYLKNTCKITDDSLISEVLKINTELHNSISKDIFAKNIKWRLKKFEFSNMFCYGENNVISFDKCKNIVGLFANNQSGKSSIMSSLLFCLFDKFDRGNRAAHILNNKKSHFSCKLNFEINGVDFFIEKKGVLDKKKNVKVDIKFWKVENGITTNLQGVERSDTNDIIKDYIGTYEDFILTSLSIQSGKNISSFIDMTQSERKDLLSQFIGLSIFDKLLELSSEKLKDITSTLKVYRNEDYQTKLQNFNNELSSLTNVFNDESEQLNGLYNDRKVLNTNILDETKKLKSVDGALIDVNVAKSKVLDKGKELEANNKNKVGACKSLTNLDNLIKPIELRIVELESKDILITFKQYQTTKSELSHLNQVFELKKVDVNGKIKKLDMLKKHEYDPNCRFCVNSVFVKDAKKTTEELEQDKVGVKSLLEEINKTKTKLNELEWVVQSQEEYTQLLRKRNEYTISQTKLTTSIRNIENSILSIETELVELNKSINLYNTQIESIEFNKALQATINELSQKLRNIDFQIEQKTKNFTEINGRLLYLNNQISIIIATIDKVKKLENQCELYTLYTKTVNRDGLPYIIISDTVPVIEREVNNILHQIVDFTISIETDGKNVIPYIVKDNNKLPIEMSCGFERFVSSLAIRVALIAISNSPKVDGMLAIDEGFGVIDADNMSQMSPLFELLKTKFECVIVISHLDTLRDMVDNHIEIKMEDGFSKVEYI